MNTYEKFLTVFVVPFFMIIILLTVFGFIK